MTISNFRVKPPRLGETVPMNSVKYEVVKKWHSGRKWVVEIQRKGRKQK